MSVKPALILTAVTLGALFVTPFWFLFWAASLVNQPRPSAGTWIIGYFQLGVSVLLCGWAVWLWLLWARQ